jgi:FlaA1/EpsC-like NDP-sugar epimerase
MLNLDNQNLKKWAIVVHDGVMTALAVWLAFVVRFEGKPFDERIGHLWEFLPFFVILAGVVYWYFGLYQSKWRFASLPDLSNIVRAATLLAAGLLVADYVLVSPSFYGFYFFGKITIALYWLLQLALLGGPRLAYRYLKHHQVRQSAAREEQTPTLILGRATEVEVVLRAIETGSIKRVLPVGILSPRTADLGQRLRGVRVLGLTDALAATLDDLTAAETPVRRLIATSSALADEAHPEAWLAISRKAGLQVSQVDDLAGPGASALAPVDIEDLLLRPSVEVDRALLQQFLDGQRIAVTGGGGSIGSEICLRCAAFGASDILVIENSEPALFHITEELAALSPHTSVHGVLADVRDGKRLASVLASFKPDTVIHAAALKHVPYLEEHWMEGIRTNIFGSANTLDAALKAGAQRFVMVSTDKAVEPVSMLGVTKRFAEIVTQARDARLTKANLTTSRSQTRAIAVRFGNVLGSVGSVVPKFKAQIARGGPVTVTDPDMIRYFMTIREACDLVLTAAAHTGPSRLQHAASVFVLKMGQPVRIMELAERMIRLAGYTPGTDIEIAVTGIRPGERLNEILFADDEPMTDIGLDGIMAATPAFADEAKVRGWITRLETAVTGADRAAAEAVLSEAIPGFKPGLKPRIVKKPRVLAKSR